MVDNRAGASGNIGVELAVNAPPDGYTFLVGNATTNGINPTLFASTMRVKPAQDLTGVSLLAAMPHVLLASSKLPPNTFQELIAYAKARPGEFNYTAPLRILAVSSIRRATALPRASTLAEAALPGFDYAAWAGYLAPAGTPPEIISRLHAEITQAVGQPDVAEIFVRLGFEVMTGTPDEFARLIRLDMARVGSVVREAGIPV